MKTSTKWSIKTLSNLIATWVAILAAVFAICQYEHNLTAEKVKETLKYVDQFNSGQVLKNRLQVEKFVERHIGDFNRAPNSEEAYSTIIMDMIKHDRMSESVDTIVNFFDNVYICTRSKLCDEETTMRFFGLYNHQLKATFHPYIMERRKSLFNKSIGCGVESIAESYKNHITISNIPCGSAYLSETVPVK